MVLDEEFATSGFYVREKSSDKKPGKENFIHLYFLSSSPMFITLFLFQTLQTVEAKTAKRLIMK